MRKPATFEVFSHGKKKYIVEVLRTGKRHIIYATSPEDARNQARSISAK